MGSCASRRADAARGWGLAALALLRKRGLLGMLPNSGLPCGSTLCHLPALLCLAVGILSSVDIMLLCTTEEPRPTGQLSVSGRIVDHGGCAGATTEPLPRVCSRKRVACVISATHKPIHQASSTAPTSAPQSRRAPHTGETNTKQQRRTYPTSEKHAILRYR